MTFKLRGEKKIERFYQGDYHTPHTVMCSNSKEKIFFS